MKKTGKVLSVLALVCMLVIGAAFAVFADDVTESKTYEGGLTVDGSEAWNTSDGDNYLITDAGVVITFTNNPFVRDTDNWSNFIIETVATDENAGVTLRADAYGWTYGDGAYTPYYEVSYDWDWEDFPAICTENTEVTLTAVRWSDVTVCFNVEFGDSGHLLSYVVYYDNGVPDELWFHLGADGGSITINSVEYLEWLEIESIYVDYLPVSEYDDLDTISFDGMVITANYVDGTSAQLTMTDEGVWDSYGNYMECRACTEFWIEDGLWYRGVSYFEGDVVYEAASYYFVITSEDVLGRVYLAMTTDAMLTVNAPTLSSIEEAGVTELELYDTYEVNCETPTDYEWYSFTPETSGTYIMKSFDNYVEENGYYASVYVQLFSSDGETVSRLDARSGNSVNGNGYLKYELEAGVTYYYRVMMYDVESCSFGVILTEDKDIASLSVDSLTQTEFARFIDEFDLSGTVVSLTYSDGTTGEVVISDKETLDQYCNYITYDVNILREDSSYVYYAHGSVFYDEPGTYTVSIYDISTGACDNSHTITVISPEDDEDVVKLESLNQKYAANSALNAGEIAWFSFTPEEDGLYYFVCSTDAEEGLVNNSQNVWYFIDGSYEIYYPEEAVDEETNIMYGAYDEETNTVYNVFELSAGTTYYLRYYYEYIDYGTEDEAVIDYETELMVSAEVRDYSNHAHVYDGTLAYFYWNWAEDYSSATLETRCDICLVEESTAATVTAETVEATETEDGSILYTATAVLNGITYTDTRTVVIPATGSAEEETTQAGTDESETTAATDGTSDTADGESDATADVTVTVALKEAMDGDGNMLPIYASEEEAAAAGITDGYILITESTVTVDLTDEDVAAIISATIASNTDASEGDVVVLKVVEVSCVGNVTFPLTLTFTVDGATAENLVAVLHCVDGTWKAEDFSVDADGNIVVTVDSLSPFAFVVTRSSDTEEGETGTNNTASSNDGGSTDSTTAATDSSIPNTGDVAVWGYYLILCASAVLVALFARKRTEA